MARCAVPCGDQDSLISELQIALLLDYVRAEKVDKNFQERALNAAAILIRISGAITSKLWNTQQ
jgi:hypothetical protein